LQIFSGNNHGNKVVVLLFVSGNNHGNKVVEILDV